MTAKITEGVEVRVSRLAAIILLAVCWSIFNHSPALAQSRPGNRYEQDALDWYEREIRAGKPDACSAYGALWLTKDSDDDPFGGDQVGVIDVAHDATEAFVRMRGSVWNCNRNNYGYNSYASNIRRGSGDNANRLFLENGQPLYSYNSFGSGLNFLRGEVARYGWSADSYAKNHVRLKVDIRNFAQPGESKNMTVSIFRCFSQGKYNVWEDSKCKSDDYYLTIKRASKPIQPELKPWQIEARSFVRKVGDSNWGDPSRTVSATVGQQVEFRHYLANRGAAGNDVINWSIKANHKFNENSQTLQIGTSNRSPLFANGLFMESSANPLGGGRANSMRYTIKPSDVGKTICQAIEFSPNSGQSAPIADYWQSPTGGSSATRMACVYAAADYQITPIVPVAGGSADCKYSCDKEVEAGSSAKLSPALINIPDSKVFDIDWKLTSFVVKPDQFAPGKNADPKGFKTENGEPCSSDIYSDYQKIYSPNQQNPNLKIKSCQVEQFGRISSGQFVRGQHKPNFEVAINQHLHEFITPEAAPVGTKYCFALSISPHKMDGSWTQSEQANFRQWYHGEPGCIVIVKRPKVQVVGGGVYANGSILSHHDSDLSFRGGRYYGSWVEYEALAVGENRNFATNGVFSSPDAVGGFAGGINQRPVRYRLAMANSFSQLGKAPLSAPFAGRFGRKTHSAGRFFEQLRNSFSATPKTSVGEEISGDFTDAEPKIFKPNSNQFEIKNINVSTKTLVVYAPEAVVKISGNITTRASQSRIPQVIILAKDIKIDGQVEKINAWLVAQQTVDTCYQHRGQTVSDDNIRQTICDLPLRITGPVAVGGQGNSLKLRRTAGSFGIGDLIGDPSEVFDLNPEVYLWLNDWSAQNGKITTTHIKELPTRL